MKPILLIFLTFSLIAPLARSEDETVFFAFDDHSLPWKKNLKLTMVPPEKHPDNPLLPRGPKGSPDELGVQFYGSVIQHGGKFKMWYIALDASALQISRMGLSGMRPAYAESDDGIHWAKPNLGLVEFAGNKENNLVLMDPPGTCGIHLIVIHEPDDPDPKARFKMMLTSLTKPDGKSAISDSVAFVSEDGLRWKGASPLRYEDGYVNSEDLKMPPVHFEQGGLFRWKGMYHLCGQQITPWIYQPDGKPVGRAMCTFRSPDFVDWSPEPAFGFMRTSAIGKVGRPSEDKEAHLPSSVWHRGNVLLGVYGLWEGAEEWKDRRIDLGLIVSNDGIHFREPQSDYVMIKRGEVGEWDVGGLLQGQGFAHVGEESYIYYGSWDLTVAPKFPPRGGVGLVRFRRDGFGYLSQQRKDAPATFETKLLQPSEKGDRLFVNVDQVSKDAPLIVELLDEKNQPIPGYSGDQSAIISTSGLHQELIWPSAKSSGIPLKQPYTVRINLSIKGDAHFYALYSDSK